MENNVITFSNLGLSEKTLALLEKKGFKSPTPIQQQTIPLLLQGSKDIVAQAQTGTGKTAAFGLPLIELLQKGTRTLQALVLAPTRELAIQVAEELQSFAHDKDLRIVPIYGGQSIETQFRNLERGVDIVVGTPGRVKDHIKRKTLALSTIRYVVLDEADEMLNMGFIDEVEEILHHIPSTKRMLLFSATMPSKILELARKYMNDFDTVAVKSAHLTANLTKQVYCEVNSRDKLEALCRLIDIEYPFYGIVFCRTKRDVDSVANKLLERGYAAEALHGDISQAQRERILKFLKTKKLSVLVATDVAARGIDVAHLSHVINYALPEDPEAYVHRIGRTGRAGNSGLAISLISGSEFRKLSYIKKVARADITKMELPSAKDIIAAKKKRIETIVLEAVTQDNASYMPLAQSLLINKDPQAVIAALLKKAFNQELDESSYTECAPSSSSTYRSSSSHVSTSREPRSRYGRGEHSAHANSSSTSRLFVAKGKVDGMNARALVEFISDKSHVNGRNIDNVKVLDSFSFITVSNDDAEIILQSFRGKGSQKPLITRAKAV